MNYSFRYKPNPAWEEAFLRSSEASKVVNPTLEAIAERAREIAPVDTRPTASGTVYKNSIRTRKRGSNGSADWSAVVFSTDPKAHLIEWGTIHMKGFGTLRRAAEQIVGTENVRGGD